MTDTPSSPAPSSLMGQIETALTKQFGDSAHVIYANVLDVLAALRAVVEPWEQERAETLRLTVTHVLNGLSGIDDCMKRHDQMGAGEAFAELRSELTRQLTRITSTGEAEK